MSRNDVDFVFSEDKEEDNIVTARSRTGPRFEVALQIPIHI
jgi:hypothetical protein